MKKILFIHSSSELYGSDKSLLNIIKYINKSKYKIYVILPCEGPLVAEIKKIPEVTVEIFDIAVLRRKNLSFKGGLTYIKNFISSNRYIKRFIKKNHIDIVDTNTAVIFSGAIAARRSGIKSVWHIREIIKNRIENSIISMVMNRYADIIVANSISTGKSLKVDRKKIRIIYNGVEESPDSILLPHNGKNVGMAGRINRWKGQKLFVDAAEIVHKVIPDAIFKIAGDAYEGEDYIKEELEKYIEEKKLTETVLLLGQIKDMKEFYRTLDIFVLPSIQPEPFGLVVIEAMEFGIPVIATNHGGPTEIINDGVDGYLVDYINPEEMAERIIELIQDQNKRKLMGNKGKKEKRNKFSVINMVKHIENILDE